MVLGKLPVPGRPTNLDKSKARTYCACSTCGWGLFGHFFSQLSFLFSFFHPLWETARYRLKYCLKGPLSPKTTNQPMAHFTNILGARSVHVSCLCFESMFLIFKNALAQFKGARRVFGSSYIFYIRYITRAAVR